MNAAEKVIQKFGGLTPLARAIHKRPSVPAYWAKSGTIPAKWQPILIEIARDEGIDLDVFDFVPLDGFQKNSPGANAAKKRRSERDSKVPRAEHWGDLEIADGLEIACYVLDDDRRVISRTGATDVLTDGKGGGNLESYLYVAALKSYLPEDFPGSLIEFELSHVVNKTVTGMEADTFLEICRAYVTALKEGALKTESQLAIAIRAAAFLASCAKVGLTALIDECTGFQYVRADNALRIKLKVYLADEMRKWEKTFPDELWREFGRLTNWKGSLNNRPKYWGHLVNELVYDYLDRDVAEWLRANVPRPRGRETYHQWLNEQFGLKRLIEHIWLLVGMASACYGMPELRRRMGEKFGGIPVQTTLMLTEDLGPSSK